MMSDEAKAAYLKYREERTRRECELLQKYLPEIKQPAPSFWDSLRRIFFG